MARRKSKSKSKSSKPGPSVEIAKSVRQIFGSGAGSGGQSMSRMASLAVLLAIIVIILVMFYRVMAGFVLPLFLAALCAVIFRPIHHWMLTKLGDRESMAAGLTTAAILGIVMLPLSGTLMLAGTQAYRKYQLEKDNPTYLDKLADFGTQLGFARPFKKTISVLDDQVTALPDRLPSSDEPAAEAEISESIATTIETLESLRNEIRIALDETKLSKEANQATPEAKAVGRMLKAGFVIEVSKNEATEASALFEFDTLDHLSQILKRSMALLDGDKTAAEPDPIDETAEASEDADAIEPDKEKKKRKRRIILPREDFPKIKTIHQNLLDQLHGSALRRYATDIFFPSRRNLDDAKNYVDEQINNFLPSVTGQATAFITQILVGIAIMTLGLYYFLKDGPGMIRAIMRLSPLDDRYELELLSEFDSVSRAVVLATLLSALAQGILAGIGYYFAFYLFGAEESASLSTVFLLTMMTTVMAMVPVVGAGAVWMPACVWLAVVDNRIFAAVVLAIYGATIVSMIDNVIKPVILHGQSNLHPLLALLSVLGGVSALGPIGIIVGPMVVAFLQALLNMLHLEIQAFDSAEPEEEPAAQ